MITHILHPWQDPATVELLVVPVEPQPVLACPADTHPKHRIYAWNEGWFALERYPSDSLILKHCPLGVVGDRVELLEEWRKLTTSDHVYYMCAKADSDGEVHAHFSPYSGPQEAFVRFMSVLDDLAARVAGKASRAAQSRSQSGPPDAPSAPRQKTSEERAGPAGAGKKKTKRKTRRRAKRSAARKKAKAKRTNPSD